MKKNLLLTFAIGFFISHAVNLHADEKKASIEDFIQDGGNRIATILFDGDHGIKTYNQQIIYADTQNLYEDVLLQEIADSFATHTHAGKLLLIDNLSNIISPKDTSNTVNLRKNGIYTISQNIQLQDKLNQILEEIKETELSVMQLFAQRHSALQALQIPNLDHWGLLKPVVKIPYLIEEWRQHDTRVNLSLALGEVISIPILAFLAYRQLLLTRDAYKEFNNNNNNNRNIWNKNISNFKLKSITIDSIIELLFTNPFSDSVTYIIQMANGARLSAIGSIGIIIGQYNNYNKEAKNRKLIQALHRYIMLAEKIASLCSEHAIATQSNLQSITDPKGMAMIARLKESQTSIKAVVTSNVFINEIFENDLYLAPYFGLVAEVDIYQTLASTIHQAYKTAHEFCFNTIIDGKKPEFNGKNFWNVMVKDAIPNTLAEDRNIILTGPNAGGKSTSIRSILQNIILSQTFGIAAASSFALTPYDAIYSSLKISDDITNGLSRYASELQRAALIVNKAASLRADEKFFFVFDELFTGTGATEGEYLSYEYINEDLAPYLDNIQFIFATHFNKLKKLEEAIPTYFVNYKIDTPTLNERGKLKYPFTISKGANNINIAALMKQEAGLYGKRKK